MNRVFSPEAVWLALHTVCCRMYPGHVHALTKTHMSRYYAVSSTSRRRLRLAQRGAIGRRASAMNETLATAKKLRRERPDRASIERAQVATMS